MGIGEKIGDVVGMNRELNTHVGCLHLMVNDPSGWGVYWDVVESGNNQEIVKVCFTSGTPQTPPAFVIEWRIPQIDISFEVTPNHVINCIPPDWGEKVVSDLAHNAPMIALASENGDNRLMFAFSDALHYMELQAGINEENSEIVCRISGFITPEAPLTFYEAFLLLDSGAGSVQDAVRRAVRFWETTGGYTPAAVPLAARLPIYSFWYSYHQNIDADSIEAECRRAAELGMKTIIVDDGWQTDDNHRGYAFCGDWEPSRKRFPDIVEHVKRVHALGMREIFWFSVAHVGFKSKSYERFKGKYLYECESHQAAIFDPRFPEVREYLIGIYERAVKEWDLDGLKLDFIDSFKTPPEDPAVQENYAGRDCKSVPQAVNLLMKEVRRRLTAIRPDLLIEFRQHYNGPAIRQYGNMFRVCDCPGDIFVNRAHSLEMRLLAGNTAVHSDMLEWHMADSVESAARQFLAILFAVPQISVKLALLPPAHKAMLSFWLNFWEDHNKTLLDGKLTIDGLQFNVTAARAEDDTCCIGVCYASGHVMTLDCTARKESWVINATAEDSLVLDNTGKECVGQVRDAIGADCGKVTVPSGVCRITVPVSGSLLLLP